ncbi:hypothetical protein JCM11251_004355 [Rhodosporidiobolus azoricus]
MASFFARFVTGGALAGVLVTYYHDDIARTTDKLSSDLKSLSKQLVQSSPSATSSAFTLPANQPVIPQRLPFTEELKARWNEQLGSALYSLQTTDFTEVFSRTFAKVQSSVASASSSAPSSPASVAIPGSAPTLVQPETLASKMGERQV